MRSAVLLIGSMALATGAMAAEPTATARLIDVNGKSVVAAWFTDTPGSALMDVGVRG